MKARHSAGFRLYHRPEHAKPSRHHNRAMRAASLFLAAACLLLGALGIANMWAAIFADVGVMVLAVLNATRALYTKNLTQK